MSDDKHEVALRIVAARVMAAALREDLCIEPDWGNYPDIGHSDWTRIMEEVTATAKRLDTTNEAYRAAYGYLEALNERAVREG